MRNMSDGCLYKVHPVTVVPRAFAVFAFLFCLVLLLPFSAFAQKSSGQITGNVVDPNGAAVVGAAISVTQVGTGLQRSMMTSDDGNYSVPDLPIGIYRVSVTKAGFKESVAENVTVNVASVTRQDFSLEIGQVGETVTIQAAELQVETQTGSIGEVVDGQQVRELPLNGRSFVQLTQLSPGVSPQNNFDSKNKGLFSGVDFSVNGNSAQANLFMTDGANNNDTGSNRTILLYPSIEAIAEFKMQRNSYGPEYGQAAGAIISIATRSGSNKFHGSLFYFGRNDALNAAEFFANASGLGKDKLRRHDFGGSLGGPILKDRLYFFYSQEFNREIRGQTRFARVPTAAERTGDFRESLTRPTCSLNLIGNGRPGSDTQVIPQADRSPAGLLLAQLYPLPNRPFDANCNNWAVSTNSPVRFREENVRIDYDFNKSNRIFGRYTQDHWSNPSPILFGAGLWGDDPFPTVESSWSQPSRQAAIKLTSTLSTTAVNEVTFAYSANRINVDIGTGADLNRQINEAIPGFFPTDAKVNGVDRTHPVFWGGIQPFTSNRGPDLWTEAPFRNALDIYSIRDDFSKVAGNHTMKMGFLLDKAAKNEDSGSSNETPQFWGACCANNSGNYLADVLTRGSRFGFSESDTMAVANTRYTNLEFYFGDTWKVRPNVTLELGARYSIYFEPYDAKNEISSFNPALYNPARPATDPCNGLVVPKGAGNICANIPGASAATEFSNRSLRKNNFKNIAPRLGVAWDVFKNGKTALRAGLGQFFLRERASLYFAALTQNPPFVRSIGGTRTLDAPAQFFDLPASAGVGSPRFSFDPRATTPYSWQFNLTADQELWKGAVLELAYVGNRARNQLTHYDINAVPEARRLQAAFAADAAAVNALRPFSNYGTIYEFSRRGRANYDSLQVLFKTRFWTNSQFQAAYTWSKSLSDFGLSDSSGSSSEWALLDVNNPDYDYGPSDINRPHMFVANAVVNLPSLKNSNAFVRSILGGWELASIIQISTGTSLTPTIAATGLSYELFTDPDGPGPLPPVVTGTRAFQAGFAGTGTGVANLRPNRVAGVPCDPNSSDPAVFLNSAAYTVSGIRIGTPGNSQRGSCLGSPTKNVDFSLYKNFSPRWLRESFLGEEARVQFRIEMFNAFNTAQFRGDAIGRNFNVNGGLVVCGTGNTRFCTPTNNVITGFAPGTIFDSNFGRSGTTRGGREIQYALRLNF